ncbi:MAG: alginate O-acetyltransferase AlgX-related protein [Candidatus Binatia bacterium]
MRMLRNVVLLTLPAIVLALAVLELGALSLLVPVDDVPLEWWDESARILKYRPNQQGVSFPEGDRRRPVCYAINADGWNSVHPRYSAERRKDLRVAVVGDSYVAAFQVDPADSVSGRLEALLGSDRAEVYAFGMNGAHLSQYLHVARHVIERYRPDVIVLLLVHNDFDESYRTVAGRYTASFLRLRAKDDGVEEVSPAPYPGSPVADWIRTRSATFRFLFYRLRVGSQLLRDLYFRAASGKAPRYEANVDVGELEAEEQRLWRATRYVLGQIALLQQSSGVPFVLLMDTPRLRLYQGRDPAESDAYRLNRMAAALAADAGIEFVDLTETFRDDYEQYGRRFDFPTDGHWNARAHRLAARELCRALGRTQVDPDGGCNVLERR